jgi:two-component system, response regulator YesN
LLVADDEDVEREAVRFFASSYGTGTASAGQASACFGEIAEAANGEEAVEAASRFRPDVIVMDIRMPGMSGLEAAAAIRAFDRRVRMVFLTAFGELDCARAAFKVQADDFLLKPMSEAAFREAMDRSIAALRDSVGASGERGSAAGYGMADAERRLLEAIRRGVGDAAATAASRAFDEATESDSGLQEARRAGRLILSALDNELRAEFGRTFTAFAGAAEALRGARSRGEAFVAVVDASRRLAQEAAALMGDPRRKAVDAALAYIATKQRGPISLEEASRAAGLSRYHFSRVFHEATGSTFTDYVCAKRIDKAKELLADESLPLKRVCDIAGFSTPSYFAGSFKKREGVSPSEFRSLIVSRTRAKLLNKAHENETHDQK